MIINRFDVRATQFQNLSQFPELTMKNFRIIQPYTYSYIDTYRDSLDCYKMSIIHNCPQSAVALCLAMLHHSNSLIVSFSFLENNYREKEVSFHFRICLGNLTTLFLYKIDCKAVTSPNWKQLSLISGSSSFCRIFQTSLSIPMYISITKLE